MARFSVVVSLLITLAIDASGQTPSPSDPGALAIINSCLTSQKTDWTGGTQELSAAGTITYFWGDKAIAASALVRSRGTDQFRVDAMFDEGTRTWIDNGGQIIAKESDGSIRRTLGSNVLFRGAFLTPLLAVLTAVNDPYTAAFDLGDIDVLGASTHHILFRRAATKDELDAAATGKDFEVFLDVKSCLILKTRASLYPASADQAYWHELYFGDYREHNGMTLAHSVSEVFGNQKTWTIQVNMFTFNPGLSDTDFTF